MPSGKEIRTKIKSVENTRKITKAMEMVAASKMRKAQERMRASRPYGEKIRRVAAHLSHALTEYRHPFLLVRDPVKRVGMITVTSDKGLCGGLNSNVLRLSLARFKEWTGEGKKVQVTAIGNKGFGFMQRLGAEVVSHVTGLGDTLLMLAARGNHAAIERWRRKQSLGRTWERRPDLLRQRDLSREEQGLLDEYLAEQDATRHGHRMQPLREGET